jgi:hypothetical protein
LTRVALDKSGTVTRSLERLKTDYDKEEAEGAIAA